MVVEWKAALQAIAPKEATTTVVVSSKPTQDKGKRKIAESAEVEQSYKFKEDPLLERVALEIDAKRHYCQRRVAQRKRGKQRLEEVERIAGDKEEAKSKTRAQKERKGRKAKTGIGRRTRRIDKANYVHTD